ncbi:MAG TPA: group 1 truncated hemoglobin [Betaproteobacteria bacterium]|nr:group 1 truncated hemoglobin [Betaproteobacteria bacterium]
MHLFLKYWFASASLIVGLNGCTSLPAHHEKSLYDRLGGGPVIASIVDDFLRQLHTDPLLQSSFGHTDMTKFRQLLIQQLCYATDGGCIYQGPAMPDARAGPGVQPAQFNAWLHDMASALDANCAGLREKNEVLGILFAMEYQIVAKTD